MEQMKFLSYSRDWRFWAGFRSPGTFQYMGVTDIQFIHANGLDLGDKARKRGIDEAQSKVQELVDGW
jgi:hypothetical protein